jgi:activator of Hsp90 ATPase-like protein
MANEKKAREPIQQSVHVDCPVEEAYRLFTEGFGEWWPGDDEEPRAVEKRAIDVWDPPRRIEFTWGREDNQRVHVDFRVEADGTRVTLTHYGWERGAVTACASRFTRFVCEQMLAAV